MPLKCGSCGLYNPDGTYECRRCRQALQGTYDRDANEPVEGRRRHFRDPRPVAQGTSGALLVLVIGVIALIASPLMLYLLSTDALAPESPLRAIVVVNLISGPVYVTLGLLMRRGARWALFVAVAVNVSILGLTIYLNGIEFGIGPVFQYCVTAAMLLIAYGEM